MGGKERRTKKKRNRLKSISEIVNMKKGCRDIFDLEGERVEQIFPNGKGRKKLF